MCRKKNFSTGNWRTLWKDFFPQPIHPHSTAPVDTGSACTQCARWLFANRYFPDPPGIGGWGAPGGNFARESSANRYCPSSARYRYRVEIEAAHQSPPCQRGVVWRSQTGGIPQVGRFPHRFILSESACCRIPQSKIKDFCQLPLAREPCGVSPLLISAGSARRNFAR